VLALLALPGCVWLRNEFFVFDVAPPAPPPAEADATAPPW